MPRDTEITEGAAGETAIVQGGAQSTEAQGRGRRANQGRWQAEEGGGAVQGKGKGTSGGGGGQAPGKGQVTGSGEGGQAHGKGKGAASSGGGQPHGKGKGTGGGGGGAGHGKGHGQGSRREGAHRGNHQGQVRDLGAATEGATRATTGREDGAQGREGLIKSKGCHPQGKGDGAAAQPEVQAVRCIPPGIEQMPAHHHHHHHPLPIYNIDSSFGALVPTQLPHYQDPPQGDAPHDPAPAAREPRA